MQEFGMKIVVLRAKRKTMCLSVDKDGNALVRVPYGVGEEEIFSFVKKHERWLERRLAERKAVPELNYRDGDVITLFGMQYLVSSGRACIGEGVIFLPKDNREKALVRLLKKLTLTEMSRITEKIAADFGLSYAKLRVSAARGRWGSCNKYMVIAYSFRIAFLPFALCEYVAVHELCHTCYFNHGALFWREVERILPDWRTRRKQLRACGRVMNYL